MASECFLAHVVMWGVMKWQAVMFLQIQTGFQPDISVTTVFLI